MPAKSKAQQRLFQMALAVRHGDLDRSKVYKSVLDIVDSDMTDEQIKHFTVLKESIYNGYEIKFYNSVIKKYNLDIDKIKSCLNNVDDIDLIYNDNTLILHIDDSLLNHWNKYLDKINEIFSTLKINNIPNDALLKFAESGEHEEIYQEVESVIKECDGNFATPMNTIGMGNVNIDGGPDLIPPSIIKHKRLKHKRRMKTIKEYIMKKIK